MASTRCESPKNIWMCRSCNADVFMVRHWKSNKKMIFNAQPAAKDADSCWVIKDGVAVIARTTQDNPRFVTHYATCPEASRWRKRRKDG